ncbi:MAG: hypothetical protein LBR93_04920 [Treponema sp.]|nr:hypothetical protein [Treponema sp.]
MADFRAILGIDDREDALSRYCLITATYTIEQYCKRRLLRRKHTDYLTFTGEHIFSLREYPVRRVLTVHAVRAGAAIQGEALFTPENLVDPKHYFCLPDEGIHEDIPFSLVLRPPIRLSREDMGIRVRYLAGYSTGKAPPDLASACLELAAGPKTFVVIWEFVWLHAMPHFRSNTLTGSRALSGVEYEPLPGASPAKRVLYWDHREHPGEREGWGTSGSVHAGECAATFRTV